ncbi:nucleoredoxin-like protein 2 [Artemia franciscana]|uniref:nucleoredoxin-like protein 2 n=1 Tax=Artemia franciscana TaxID=6661 RepID=UPI0032DB68AD
MNVLAGKMLMQKSGNLVSAEQALANKQVIGYYFSAHWCPPCKQFTPVLADFYQELKDNDAPFEIIFVSSDRSEQEMKSYMQELHGDWYAIPLGDPVASTLKKTFSVTGIPAFIIVKRDGTVITTNGRADVQMKGPACFTTWASQ